MRRRKRRSNGFMIVELIAAIVILTILLTIFMIVFKKGIEKSDSNMTCVEWEDAHMTDCWSYGMGTSCESYVEKRCVRYDDGNGKRE